MSTLTKIIEKTCQRTRSVDPDADRHGYDMVIMGRRVEQWRLEARYGIMIDDEGDQPWFSLEGSLWVDEHLRSEDQDDGLPNVSGSMDEELVHWMPWLALMASVDGRRTVDGRPTKSVLERARVHAAAGRVDLVAKSLGCPPPEGPLDDTAFDALVESLVPVWELQARAARKLYGLETTAQETNEEETP